MLQQAGIVARIEAFLNTAVVAFLMWVATLILAVHCIVVACRGASEPMLAVLVWAGPLLLVSLWYVRGTARRRATYGMRQRSLCFCGVHGDEVSRRQCAIRALAGILTLPLCPISFILILTHGRSLADMMCGVAVVVAETKPLGHGFEVLPARLTGAPGEQAPDARDGPDAPGGGPGAAEG